MKKEIDIDKEEIYKKIMELQNGSVSDRALAFEIIGILGNEYTGDSYESKLEVVNEMINNHELNKK